MANISGWCLLLGLGLVGASGCAATPTTMPDGSPLQRFMLRGPGYAREATYDGSTMANPNTSLERFPDGIRGRLWGITVVTTTKPGHVTGVVGGGAPVDLVIDATDPNAFKANGLWAGKPARLEITDKKLTLTYSQCGFDLDRAGPATFQGRTACFGGLADRIQLDLPPAIFTGAPEERAVWITAFLQR